MGKKRFAEFDLAKAFFCLGLPFVHFLEFMLYNGKLSEEVVSLSSFITLLTIFGPSIFMICMGFGMAGEYNPKRLFKTGIQFIIIGYFLNLCIYTIPGYIIYFRGLVDYSIFGPLKILFTSEIYVFVGFFYLFYSLIKKLKINNIWLIIISIIMLIINSFTCRLLTNHLSFVDYLLSQIVSLNLESYFTLFGWTIFPVIGIVMADILKKQDEIKYHKSMIKIFFISIILLSIIIGICIIFKIDLIEMFTLYVYGMLFDGIIAAILILIALIVISGIHLIYNAVKSNALENWFISFSPLITPYYIIQMLINSLVCYYIIDNITIDFTVGILASIILMLTIFSISLFIACRFGFTIIRFVLKITDFSRWFKWKKR